MKIFRFLRCLFGHDPKPIANRYTRCARCEASFFNSFENDRYVSRRVTKAEADQARGK